jgi:hypothetical protein
MKKALKLKPKKMDQKKIAGSEEGQEGDGEADREAHS